MPLFAVRGKFANGHTFSVNPVDGTDAAAALGSIVNGEEVKTYGHPIVAVSVMKLEGKKRLRISDEPAKPRAKGAGRKPATPAAAAPAGNTGRTPATTSRR